MLAKSHFTVTVLVIIHIIIRYVLTNASASRTSRRTWHSLSAASTAKCPTACLTGASHDGQKWLRDRVKVRINNFNLPSECSQPQSSAGNVFPCHCWTWWNNLRLWYFVLAEDGGNMLGWMDFYRVVTSSWKCWYLMVSRWSFSVPFCTMVMASSPAAMPWSLSKSSHFWTLTLVPGKSHSLWQVSIQLLSRSQIAWM